MTQISIQCPHCKMTYNGTQESFARIQGKKTVCKKCLKDFVVRIPVDDERTNIVSTGDQQGLYSKAMLSIVPNDQTMAQTYPIVASKNSVGRLSDMPGAARADIAIITDDRYMSKLHASIEVLDRGSGRLQYLLRDMKSANHVFLTINGMEQELEADEAFFLVDGDHFRLGRTEFVFQGTL
jgi:FHA domain